MEILKTAKIVFDQLTQKEREEVDIKFKGLYHLQRKSAEYFPLEALLGKSPKGKDFIWVQRSPEAKKSEAEDDCSEVYSDEESSESVLNDLGDSIHIDTSLAGVARKTSTVRPLTVKEARFVLSIYATANNPHMQDDPSACGSANLPVWIPCVCQEPEYTAYMGSQLVTSSSGQVSGFSSYKVSCTGPMVEKSELPTLDQLLRNHRYNSDSHHVSSKGYAQYDVFGSVSHDTSISSGHLEQRSSLTIECQWDNIMHVLQQPPHSAKATVFIRLVPGDPRSLIHSLYKELCTLVSFAKGLETGEIQWAKKTSDCEEDSLPNKIRSFIEDLKKGIQTKIIGKEENSREKDFESPVHRQLMPERKSLDFTEQLWNLLCTAGSYQEVKDSLDIVLKALVNSEIQPMVHRSNQTMIAKAVRLSYERKINRLQMDDSAPLELLVEIGLDKILRDYTTYFVAEKLVMKEGLEFYTKSDLAIENQIERLQRLYNILELTIGSQAFLKLPLQNHISLIRNAVKHYENNPHDRIHTFDLSIEAGLVKGLYANLQPNVWRVELRNTSDVTTVCQLSSAPCFDHVNHSETQDTSRNELEDSLYYFVTVLTQSQMLYS